MVSNWNESSLALSSVNTINAHSAKTHPVPVSFGRLALLMRQNLDLLKSNSTSGLTFVRKVVKVTFLLEIFINFEMASDCGFRFPHSQLRHQ